MRWSFVHGPGSSGPGPCATLNTSALDFGQECKRCFFNSVYRHLIFTLETLHLAGCQMRAIRRCARCARLCGSRFIVRIVRLLTGGERSVVKSVHEAARQLPVAADAQG